MYIYMYNIQRMFRLNERAGEKGIEIKRERDKLIQIIIKQLKI